MKRPFSLSPRLAAVAELVPQGTRLADVGTDHGRLPVWLIQHGVVERAVASDLRPGPLSRARALAERWAVADRISFRLCDGLSGIGSEEARTVTVAGMGGETIAEILAAAPWTREGDMTLVLQPMSSISNLRLWLSQNGYQIVVEELAREGDTLYTALLVRTGEMAPLTPAELWAGRNSAGPLRGQWLDLWLGKTERALAGLAQSRQESAPQRRRELEQVRNGLLDMKKEWEAWQR